MKVKSKKEIVYGILLGILLVSFFMTCLYVIEKQEEYRLSQDARIRLLENRN